VYHVLQVRQRQAGIAKCAPHDLRRTFATAMLDNGDLITVKDAMGHASVTTTQQYDRRGAPAHGARPSGSDMNLTTYQDNKLTR
jgi:integrase